jgi:hypothetical protein
LVRTDVSEERIASIIRAGGGDTFLQNVGSNQKYKAQDPRRRFPALKMDVCAFPDSVVNDRIENSTNIHWENMQNYKGQKENF